MLRRVEAEEPALLERVPAARTEPAVAAIAEADGELPALPRDHPRWAKDAIAISQRARAFVAKLRPAVIRVLGFWDHRLRTALVGGRSVRVEPSGCYRIE